MAQALSESLKNFDSPHNEDQLRELERVVGSLLPEHCGKEEIRSLLGVFERFPDDDGYGIFWSILHFLEACSDYEPLLVESVQRKPVEFNVQMLNRLLNSGVTDIGEHSLYLLLESVAMNQAAQQSVRRSAEQFLAYQERRGNATN
jgi:hypothetical protein